MASPDLLRKPQQLESAARNMRSAVEARPQAAELYVELAQIQFALKDLDGATKTLEKMENVENRPEGFRGRKMEGER